MSALRCISRSLSTSRTSPLCLIMPTTTRATFTTATTTTTPSTTTLTTRTTTTSTTSSLNQWRVSSQSWSVRTFAAAAATSDSFLDKKEVAARVIEVLKGVQKIDQSKISTSAHFTKDLGLDSLDTVEVVLAFEDEFGIEIPDNEADKIHSVSDAVDYISSNPNAK